MTDLISRQAAISRAVTIQLFGRDVRVVGVSELEALPSEIIRCKDCRFYRTEECDNALFTWCTRLSLESPDPDGYCSFAERRKDEGLD